VKISDALNLAKNRLQKSGVASPNLDAILLMMFATLLSKEQIVFNPEKKLTQDQLDNFWQAIRRRELREPVSHIIGVREFYGNNFFVNANVLDPRPDSESLIELVLKNFSDKNKNLEILELGVGSGCLIISLLKIFLNAGAIGVDVSLRALEVCAKNSAFYGLENKLQLLESNLFENISDDKKFDLIISNTPYIERAEIANLSDEVRCYEPILALDGGVNGLDFYHKIAKQVSLFLKPKGLIFLEIGAGQRNNVERIFLQAGFFLQDVGVDLADIERVLCFGFDAGSEK